MILPFLRDLKKQIIFLIIIVSAGGLFGDNQKHSLELTAEERAWLEEHPVIRIGPDPDFPPTEFFDEKGVYSGLAADYLRLIEQILGIDFEILRLKDWDECIEKARRREIDMFGAAMETPQRAEYMLFSDPYLSFEAVIIVKETLERQLTLEDLTGLRVAVPYGYAVHDYLLIHYPDLDLYPVPDAGSGLQSVSFGTVDAYVGNIATATFYIEEAGITNLRLAGNSDFFINLSFAVRNDWPELPGILNKALARISEKEKQDLYYRWVHIEQKRWFQNRDFLIILFSALGGVGLLFMAILLWNLSLKRLVSLRTGELHRELQQRKSAVESLIESEYRFRTLVNNIPGVVYRCLNDENWTMQFMSDFIYDISGYKASEFIRNRVRSYDSIVLPEDREKVSNSVKIGLAGMEPYILEYRIRHADGSVHWIYEKGRGIHGKDGALEYLDGVLFDISERKRAEDQLRQTQKMETVGTLAGGFAHDFNNVLGGITATVSVMEYLLEKDGTIERRKLSGHLKTLDDCSRRASSIVQHLLALSRKQELSFSPVDLNGIIRSVMKICEFSFDKSVTFDPQFSPETAMVMADPAQLEQILLNLCVNAEHAMTIMRAPEEVWGGRLSVVISRIRRDNLFYRKHPEAEPGEYWLLSVRDTGVGMDSDRVSRIFNPFFTTKQKGKGVGLGLSMVYNLVQAHSGFIDVYSESGMGAAFNLYLPVYSENIPAEEPPEPETVLPKGKGLILVVDDEDLLRRMAREILNECGYDVLTAENGKAALEIYRERHREISAVLLDMVMPEMSGKETLKEMKRINPDVKVLLASGFRQDDRVNEVMEMGVLEFIHKPYSLKILAEKMQLVVSP